MKPDWAWNHFLRALEDGTFERKLTQISKEAGKLLRVYMEVFDGTSGRNPYGTRFEGLEAEHVVTFEYQDGKLASYPYECWGRLREYKKIDCLMDLKRLL